MNLETAMPEDYRAAGGPQHTSMAVRRRNTRMEMRARTVLGMDIWLQVCQKEESASH
jgi:hypothetical protein